VRAPPRILIVDDTPANVHILQTRLAAHGYDIVTPPTARRPSSR
jgi:CheY-like chemotaxis protein